MSESTNARRIAAALNACRAIPTRQLEIVASYASDEARLSWLAWAADQVVRGNALPDDTPPATQADRLAALGRFPDHSPFALQRT